MALDKTAFISEAELANLQTRLALVDLYSRQQLEGTLELLILKKGHVKMRMRQEPNHRRPHFHIEYKQEFKASYAIDTLERLAGNMPSRYERPILEWAKVQRLVLEATWKDLQDGRVREIEFPGDEA